MSHMSHFDTFWLVTYSVGLSLKSNFSQRQWHQIAPIVITERKTWWRSCYVHDVIPWNMTLIWLDHYIIWLFDSYMLEFDTHTHKHSRSLTHSLIHSHCLCQGLVQICGELVAYFQWPDGHRPVQQCQNPFETLGCGRVDGHFPHQGGRGLRVLHKASRAEWWTSVKMYASLHADFTQCVYYEYLMSHLVFGTRLCHFRFIFSCTLDSSLITARASTSTVFMMPCLAMPCHALPCLAMPCHALPCLAMPCHALPCLAMPCHALPCLAMPCHALPCLAMPCHALPCLAMPCHALPCLAVRLGVDYYCFHDVDVAPQGSSLQEFQSNLDVISDKLLSKQKETGVKLCLKSVQEQSGLFNLELERLRFFVRRIEIWAVQCSSWMWSSNIWILEKDSWEIGVE